MARFGYETIGTVADQNIDDRISGSLFTSGAIGGTGDSITVRLSNGSAAERFKCAIYLHSDLSLVGTTEELPGNAGNWVTFDFVGSPTILASTDYILVCWGERNSPAEPRIPYDDGDGTIQGHFQSINYTGTFPNNMTVTHEDRKYSIYCDYTEGGEDFTETPSDSFSVSDSPSTTAIYSRTLSDSITFSDSPILNITIPLSDSISFNDALVLGIISVLSETFNISDSLTTSGSFTINISDNQTFSDSLSRIIIYNRTLSDTITMSDSPVLNIIIPITDSLTISDVLSTLIGVIITLTDSFSITDSLSKNVIYNRILTDTLNLTDLTQQDVELVKSDIMNFVDNISSIAKYNRIISDISNIFDILAKGEGKILTDNITFSDGISKGENKVLLDNITFTDSLSAIRQFTRALADTLSISDSLATTVAEVIIKALLTLLVGDKVITLKDDRGNIIFKSTRGINLKANDETITFKSNNQRITLKEVQP